MGSREDDAYWNDKYDQGPECDEHGDAEMYYDPDEGEWNCMICHEEDELNEVYKRG